MILRRFVSKVLVFSFDNVLIKCRQKPVLKKSFLSQFFIITTDVSNGKNSPKYILASKMDLRLAISTESYCKAL